MQNKKVAAVLAAVQLYLQQEADEAASLLSAVAPLAVRRPPEPGQWAQSGRVDMMAGRRLIQLRAFAR